MNNGETKYMNNKPLKIIEQMYNAHYSYLRNYLIGFTRSDGEADDVIQELFSNIIKNPEGIVGVENIREWLVVSARNIFLYLSKKRQPELLKDEKVMEHLLISNHAPEAEVMIKDQLEIYLNRMSTTDRAIFMAKEYYGYQYDEISGLLNIPVSTLKSRIFRIRKKMIQRRGN